MAEAPSWAEGRGYRILELGVFGDLRWGLGVQEFEGRFSISGFRMGLGLSLQVGFMLVFGFRAAHKGSGFRGVRHVSALVHICCSICQSSLAISAKYTKALPGSKPPNRCET